MRRRQSALGGLALLALAIITFGILVLLGVDEPTEQRYAVPILAVAGAVLWALLEHAGLIRASEGAGDNGNREPDFTLLRLVACGALGVFGISLIVYAIAGWAVAA